MSLEVKGKNIADWWKWLFLVAVTLLFFKAWLYVKPFFPPIFLAALLAVFLSGTHARLTKKLSGRTGLSAGIITIVVTCIIVIPLTISSFYAISNTANFAKIAMDEEKRSEWQNKSIDAMQKFAKDHPRSHIIMDKAIEIVSTDQSILIGVLSFKGIVKSIGGKAVAIATSVLSNAMNILWQMLIMLVALFVFLKNGKTLMLDMIKYVPIAQKHKDHILMEIATGINALFNSMLATGAVQGGMATITIGLYSFFYFHINIWCFVFFAFMMAFCSAFSLPLATFAVGSYVIIALVQKHFLIAIIMIPIAIAIGISDNYIKPKIMGNAIDINSFILLIFMIGGVMTEGAIGLISGPFLIILVMTIGGVLSSEYKKYRSGLIKKEAATSAHSSS